MGFLGTVSFFHFFFMLVGREVFFVSRLFTISMSMRSSLLDDIRRDWKKVHRIIDEFLIGPSFFIQRNARVCNRQCLRSSMTSMLCTAFWDPSRAIQTIRCCPHPESFVLILDWKDLMIDSVVELVEEHVDLDGSQFSESIVERRVHHHCLMTHAHDQQRIFPFFYEVFHLQRWTFCFHEQNVFRELSVTLVTACVLNKSNRSLTFLINIEIFCVFRWTCWVYICLNRSTRSLWRTKFFAKELTSISWERDVFLPSCMLSGRPDLSWIGFGVGWFDWKLLDSCRDFCTMSVIWTRSSFPFVGDLWWRPRWHVYLLLCYYSSFHPNNFRNTNKLEVFLEEWLHWSSLIECQSFLQ